MNFNINGNSIKSPSGFKIERYNITNLERLADGKMAGDLIAKKRKFYFTYEVINGSDLDTILDAIWDSPKIFFKLKYEENGSSKEAEVYVGSIPSDLYGTGADWVWTNVTFNLIER